MKKPKNTNKKTKTLKAIDPTLCSTHRLIELLSGPWTTYILWLIRSEGCKRFNELKKAMHTISAKILTESLRMLEERGIVVRYQENVMPPKVTYTLTKRGREFGKILDEVNVLAKKWFKEEK